MKNIIDSDILSVIDSFIQDEQPFSAYDITKTLRHEGLLVRHNQVKDVINNQFSIPYNYTKELHPTLQAWIYIPDGLSIDDYNPTSVPEFDVTRNVASQSLTQVVANTKHSIVNKGGRYCLPSKYVKQAGWHPHEQVHIVRFSDRLIITTDEDLGPDRSVDVDCYHNVRVPQSDIINVFKMVPSEVSVEVLNDNTITGNYIKISLPKVS